MVSGRVPSIKAAAVNSSKWTTKIQFKKQKQYLFAHGADSNVLVALLPPNPHHRSHVTCMPPQPPPADLRSRGSLAGRRPEIKHTHHFKFYARLPLKVPFKSEVDDDRRHPVKAFSGTLWSRAHDQRHASPALHGDGGQVCQSSLSFIDCGKLQEAEALRSLRLPVVHDDRLRDGLVRSERLHELRHRIKLR
jgi:hypothetical protein